MHCSPSATGERPRQQSKARLPPRTLLDCQGWRAFGAIQTRHKGFSRPQTIHSSIAQTSSSHPFCVPITPFPRGVQLAQVLQVCTDIPRPTFKRGDFPINPYLADRLIGDSRHICIVVDDSLF
jgi:hypothetical protein